MAVPAAETMLARGVPGAEDVTDGDVDYYGTDWINVENAVTEEQPHGFPHRRTGPPPRS